MLGEGDRIWRLVLPMHGIPPAQCGGVIMFSLSRLTKVGYLLGLSLVVSVLLSAKPSQAQNNNNNNNNNNKNNKNNVTTGYRGTPGLPTIAVPVISGSGVGGGGGVGGGFAGFG